MTTVLQIELKHYVDNHSFDCMLQDNGVAILIPVVTKDDTIINEWNYVETYSEARKALGY